MTLAETGQIMDILTAAYPRFYSGAKDKEAVKLWATMFEPYPVRTVADAVQDFIASDTKGFPPVIGQIMERMPYKRERATELRKSAMELKQLCAEIDSGLLDAAPERKQLGTGR